MVVIENSGTTVKVMDTDGNVYLFRFRDGSSFVANTRVKVELDITFDRKNPEHFLLNDMFILKVVVDRKGGE
jgi:hypothetical protein